MSVIEEQATALFDRVPSMKAPLFFVCLLVCLFDPAVLGCPPLFFFFAFVFLSTVLYPFSFQTYDAIIGEKHLRRCCCCCVVGVGRNIDSLLLHERSQEEKSKKKVETSKRRVLCVRY